MSDKPESKAPSRLAVILGAVVLCLTVAGGIYFSMGPEKFALIYSSSTPKPSAPKGVPIGGAFRLTDHTGAEKSDKDFAGKFMLIYFGYTYCPDVCPTSLTVMTDALKNLGAKADRIEPIFVTVDPRRDTVNQLKMYVSHFHPRLKGLTGTDEQIAEMARTFRVYFSKQTESKPGANDYLVDHSSITYFMDQNGRYLTHFGHAVTAEAMAERIKKYL